MLHVRAEQRPKKDFSLAETFQKGMEIKATEEDLALGQRQAILTQECGVRAICTDRVTDLLVIQCVPAKNKKRDPSQQCKICLESGR